MKEETIENYHIPETNIFLTAAAPENGITTRCDFGPSTLKISLEKIGDLAIKRFSGPFIMHSDRGSLGLKDTFPITKSTAHA